MFDFVNSKKKKEALDNLAKAQEGYKEALCKIGIPVTALYDARKKAIRQIEEVVKEVKRWDDYDKFEKNIVDSMASIKTFSEAVNAADKDVEIDDSVSKQMVGAAAGVLGGAMVAAFGPSAAIALATTFGTAATGAAISGLTGVAATNAALAWLGGGALAAGGGGMAAGATVLSMLGPIGWVIGGTAVGLAGFSTYKKNQKVADDATNMTNRLNADIKKINDLKGKIEALKNEIDNSCEELIKYKEEGDLINVVIIIISLCSKINKRFTTI